MEILPLLGVTLGLGFAAGINLYAAVLTIGLGAHMGLVHLPAQLDGLAALAHPSVLLLAAAFSLAQFLADKVRWLDSGWDVLHAAVRPAGAMLLAVAVLAPIDSAFEALLIALGGAAAACAHLAKAGLRLVINSIPEPLSNVGVSLVEDALVVAGTWVAVHYPVAAVPVVGTLSLAAGALAPWLVRVARIETWALGALLRSCLVRRRAERPLATDPPPSHAGLLAAPAGGDAEPPARFAIRCASGGGSGTRRNDLGFLCLGGGELLFVTRQGRRVRGFPIDLSRLEEIRCQVGPALDRLTLRTGVEHAHFLFSKDRPARLQAAVQRLGRAHAQARAALARPAARARAAANGHALGAVPSARRRNGGKPV